MRSAVRSTFHGPSGPSPWMMKATSMRRVGPIVISESTAAVAIALATR